jgi:aldose 1-epimerase
LRWTGGQVRNLKSAIYNLKTLPIFVFLFHVNGHTVKISDTLFGKLKDGREARLFTVLCTNGFSVSITNYGATLTSIKMPDRSGETSEIIAGFPDLEGYLEPHPYFGATVGRFANRIAWAKIIINNIEYPLSSEHEFYQLHGGVGGFHSRLWDYSLEEGDGYAVVSLSYLSPHLEDGFPGNLSAEVTYTVYDDNRLELEFSALTDKPTHVNLTNHAYFNLSGFDEGLTSHKLILNAAQYLELDQHQLPTGKFLPVQNTKYDFSTPRALDPEETELDFCFILNPHARGEASALLYHPGSGRRMTVFTTQPGIQVYTSNFLDGRLIGHGGRCYEKHAAICLETQHFPDSPNQPDFPSTLLKPGEKYHQKTIFLFEKEY